MPGNEAYDAALVIKQSCDDMVDSYEDLVEAGAAVMGDIKSTIGQLKQYKYESWASGQYLGVEYRDNKYSGWDKFWMRVGGLSFTEEEVPHPRRQEAYDALENAQGIVDEVDEKFELDSKDIRDTVGSVADHMSGWVDTVAKLSALVFPSSITQISTTGDTTGWQSPSAMETYRDNVTLQDSAHSTTQSVIRALLERDAAFLQNMTESLTAFADLVREQNQSYIDLATGSWKPEDLSIDFVLGKIGDVATFFNDYKSRQTEKATAMITTLNNAVTATLKTEELRGQINAMSEPTGSGGNGWPMPANLSGYRSPDRSGFEELRFNTRWFKDHIEFWEDLSDDFDPVISTASGTPAIEPMFLQFPGFSATATSGLNTLAQDLREKALARGQSATQDMSEKLDATIRNYLAGEALNTQEAEQLQRMLDE